MRFNPKALILFIGFFAFLALALSSDGGTWFYAAEAVSSVVIMIGIAGLWRERQSVN